MRNVLLSTTAAASLFVAGHAYAGGMVEPVMDPVVVAAETSSSSAGLIVPLLLLLVIAAAASSGGSGGVAGSDARLKTDLQVVGLTRHGLPLYRYRYIGDQAVFEGVLAQDVLRRAPEAVVPLAGGFMAVDYGMLGLEMRRIH